jgi:hypothetical protein
VTARWALCFLFACGAADDPQAHPHPDADPEAEAEAPKPETERERQSRLAREKREQCSAFMDAIEKHSDNDEIVKHDDAKRFGELSKQREESADAIGAVKIGDEGLGAIRDRYVAQVREIAAAFGEAAIGTDAVRRKALERVKKAQAEKKTAIDELNAYCS